MSTNPSKPLSNSDALIALIREHEGNPMQLAALLYSESIKLTERIGSGQFSNIGPSGGFTAGHVRLSPGAATGALTIETGRSCDPLEVAAPVQTPAAETKRPEHLAGYEGILRHLRTQGYLTDVDPNFAGTAKRAAEALDEMILSAKFIDDEVERELSTRFPSKTTGMVTQENIFVASVCPHHLLPVMMRVTVGYLPSSKETDRVVGLSKLTRALRLLGRQPIMQEEYTNQVIEAIDSYAKSDGTAVYVRGYHTCMALRGANEPAAVTVTTDVSGALLHNEATRAEFFAIARAVTGSFP